MPFTVWRAPVIQWTCFGGDVILARKAGRQASKHNYIQCDVHSLLTEVCARCDRSRVGGEFTLLGSKKGFTEVVTF